MDGKNKAGGTFSNPVIVVPGITASYLNDSYPLPPESIWSEKSLLGIVAGVHKDFGRLSLHPDKPRYEAREPARVTPGQVFEAAYEEIIEELRDGLGVKKNRPVPVYPFAYDWRLPLKAVESQLADFIEEVIERTRLMGRAYGEYKDCGKVNLIGHSMGGLVIAGYLADCAAKEKESRVGKVVSLATPFQGSYESVVKTATGTAKLGVSRQRSRERQAARLTPSLYHLVPSFEGALEIVGGFDAVPEDIKQNVEVDPSWFNVNVWQSSIIESIADYVGEHAVSPGGWEDQLAEARSLLSGFLGDAREHRKKVDQLNLKSTGMEKKDWLCVVGVNARTRVTLPIRFTDKGPEFDLRGSRREDMWEKKGQNPRMTGDETVPFAGAVPKFLGLENIVCVTPGDFGHFEIGDKFMSLFGGFHGILPNMNLLHRMIVCHFTGRGDRYGNTWGWSPPATGIADFKWEPPIPLESGS